MNATAIAGTGMRLMVATLSDLFSARMPAALQSCCDLQHEFRHAGSSSSGSSRRTLPDGTSVPAERACRPRGGQRDVASSEGQGTYFGSAPGNSPTAPSRQARANSVPKAIEVQYMIG